MTNIEIINGELELMERMDLEGKLKTYAEWKKLGYQVQKGQKAFIKPKLWKVVQKKEKDEEGNEKKAKGFIMKASALFSPHQVQKV